MSGAYGVIVVDDQSELHALLIHHFAEKYDAPPGRRQILPPPHSRAAG
ncbi:hypothetical protein GT039_33905 [Streptomyces sp. SID2955]|nr:hypothetical protein [Streptomyces sp. SID2955]